MGTKRRQHDGQYKFRVAMEAAKGSKTLSELASETGVHPEPDTHAGNGNR